MGNKGHINNEELKNIAPNLANLERKNALTVPHDYFNELSAKINEKITEKDSEKGYFSSAVLMRYVSATVLSVLILAVTFIYFNRDEKIATAISEIEISTEELIASSYLLGMDEYYIKEVIAGSEVDLNYFTMQNSEVADYLLDFDFDENLINNEL
jgi:hypothetical protein